jgi:hypothetical protein
MGFFDRVRAMAGDRSVTVVLGPLEIQLDGLSEALAATLFERYTPYATREAAATTDALHVRVGLDEVDYFLPPRDGELERVHLACDGDRVRYVSYRVAGWFDTRGGRGDLLLSHGDWEPELRAFENYLRAAVAWQAVSRGGALVHAASAVLNGRGYLFYGESGAGKSTLSASNRRGRVVSDDLSLIVPDGETLALIGTPFRGTYEEGDPVEGSFPLRAGFRLIQAERAEVRAVPRVRALAELVGNLPFVAESFQARPDLFASVQRSLDGIALAHLHFTKDDSYWDAIAAAGY